MKKEVADEWVTALRSGEFQQGKGALCADGKFCCLGVLSELASRSGVEIRKTACYGSSVEEQAGGFVSADAVAYDGHAHFPPPSVVEWAGLHSDNPSASWRPSLAEYNDEGVDFEGIADIIEERWELL